MSIITSRILLSKRNSSGIAAININTMGNLYETDEERELKFINHYENILYMMKEITPEAYSKLTKVAKKRCDEFVEWLFDNYEAYHDLTEKDLILHK